MRTDLAAHLGSIKWDLAPLWSVAPRVDNKNVGMVEKNLLSLSYGRVIRKDITAIGGLRPESYETYNVIEDGDVVLRMTDLQNDKKSIRTGQASERGLITSAYITVRPSQSETDPRFVAAVLRAYDIQKAYYEMGAGVRQNLGYSELIDLPIPMPPKATQQHIADYLDRETGEIDAMIAKLDDLAGVLQARRTGAIDLALLPHVGISTARLGLIAEAITGLTYAPSDIVSSGGTVVHRSGNIQQSRIDRTDLVAVSTPIPEKLRLRENDLLVCSRNGSAHLVGKNALISHEEVGESWGAFMTVLRSPNNHYLRWYLHSSLFAAERSQYSTSTINQLTIGMIQRMEIPFPSPDEQKRIADHLDEVTGKIDAMLAKVADLKSLLTERRAALITDVVTGRKEVA